MPKIKEGHIVTGIGVKSPYGFTNAPHLMLVIAVIDKTFIRVKMLDGAHTGQSYVVNTQWFNITGSKILKKVKKIEKDLEKLRKQPSQFRMRGDWPAAMKELHDINYECIDEGHPVASYTVLKADGSYQIYRGHACHSSLRLEQNRHSLYVVSWVWSDSEHARPLMNWLLKSKMYSPYIVNRTATDIFKRGIVIRSDTPSNMLSQILVITRQLWEFTDLMDIWGILCKSGMDKAIAFALCHNVYGADNTYRLGIRDSLHNAMDGEYNNMDFFKKYLIGEIAFPNEPYSHNVDYGGLFGMWTRETSVLKFLVNSDTLAITGKKVIEEWGNKKTIDCISEKSLVEQLTVIANKIEKEVYDNA